MLKYAIHAVGRICPGRHMAGATVRTPIFIYMSRSLCTPPGLVGNRLRPVYL